MLKYKKYYKFKEITLLYIDSIYFLKKKVQLWTDAI